MANVAIDVDISVEMLFSLPSLCCQLLLQYYKRSCNTAVTHTASYHQGKLVYVIPVLYGSNLESGPKQLLCIHMGEPLLRYITEHSVLLMWTESIKRWESDFVRFP